jgi:hypothetical protein
MLPFRRRQSPRLGSWAAKGNTTAYQETCDTVDRKNRHAVAYIGEMKRDGISLPHLFIDGIDFKLFGIAAIKLMSGQNAVSAWPQ